MNEDAPTIRELVTATEDYLKWQKRLGHPGVPWDLLRQRREAENAGDKEQQAGQSESPVSTKEATGETPTRERATMSSDLFDKATGNQTLDDVREELGDCTRCKLHETRNSIVFGEGDPNADIMFIGEGPGADEDAQGRPFVGRAGKLLDKWIELGMGIPREQVYIGNIVKCRPPNNRDPERDEVDSCIGFIHKQIKAINPRVIILLGRVPMKHILNVKDGITRVHGTWYEFDGIPTMPIFHPSYCLRPPQDEKRRIVWEDIKKVLSYLGMEIPKKKS